MGSSWSRGSSDRRRAALSLEYQSWVNYHCTDRSAFLLLVNEGSGPTWTGRRGETSPRLKPGRPRATASLCCLFSSLCVGRRRVARLVDAVESKRKPISRVRACARCRRPPVNWLEIRVGARRSRLLPLAGLKKKQKTPFDNSKGKDFHY